MRKLRSRGGGVTCTKSHILQGGKLIEGDCWKGREWVCVCCWAHGHFRFVGENLRDWFSKRGLLATLPGNWLQLQVLQYYSRPAASEILQWDPTVWHGLQIENDMLEKWSRMRVYSKQRGTQHLACIIALLQCQREPSWGAGVSSRSATYFCHTEVHIYWDQSRTDTGSLGSHLGKHMSHCHWDRPHTASKDRPWGH